MCIDIVMDVDMVIGRYLFILYYILYKYIDM